MQCKWSWGSVLTRILLLKLFWWFYFWNWFIRLRIAMKSTLYVFQKLTVFNLTTYITYVKTWHHLKFFAVLNICYQIIIKTTTIYIVIYSKPSRYMVSSWTDLDNAHFWTESMYYLVKGLSSKPSGNCIVAPNLCFLS